eukprot:Unigene10631_Nuclearia_a/m.32500 Unigene10631_Nuclearia_a/g.32500  ORF Unigene10631_Nuclearia_a/g.32500 Unigene10631_Nuclearia_a/m.32500 type:complete len:358 (-) Unigene10631_Nuclearia_a:71-1144(-)
MRTQELVKAARPEVALAEPDAVDRVHLRVRVQVAHALDVAHKDRVARGLVRKVREGLGRVALVLVHKPKVVVVLAVWPGDEALNGAQVVVLAVHEFEDPRLHKVDLFGWVGLVELLGPLGRKALHLGVLEVRLAVLVRIDGHLGDVGDGGVALAVAQVLQVVRLAQAAARKRLGLDLDLDAGGRPLASLDAEHVLERVLRRQRAKVGRRPGDDGRRRPRIAHHAPALQPRARPRDLVHQLHAPLAVLGLRDEALLVQVLERLQLGALLGRQPRDLRRRRRLLLDLLTRGRRRRRALVLRQRLVPPVLHKLDHGAALCAAVRGEAKCATSRSRRRSRTKQGGLNGFLYASVLHHGVHA